MSFCSRAIAVIFLLASASASAQNEIPDMAAYAWHFPVQVDPSAEFVAADIPLEVYRSISDPTLRDTGVYNSDRQAVPRIIRRSEEDPEDVEIPIPLGVVPLFGELEKSQERLRLLMENSSTGTRLQFDTGTAGEDASVEELRAYIVDLRELEDDQSFTWLEFDWGDAGTGFIGNVFIHQSDDLSGWQTLAQGTLADLEYEGTRIERNRIDIQRQKADFLRITWRDMPEEWRLEGLTGIRMEKGPENARAWRDLQPVSRSEDGRTFIFDLGGLPPVDRASLVLSGNNVVVKANLEFRSGPEDTWRHVHQGLFYNISRDGNSIASGPARLPIHRAGHWRVRIVSGRVDGNLQLKLGWRPDQLVFLNQGNPPFTLATGRAQDGVERFPHHRLLGDRSLFAMLLDGGEPGVATIGPRSQAAGAAVMTSKREWTWRTVLVWIGLVGAVLFVGWLVLSLVRESKQSETEKH